MQTIPHSAIETILNVGSGTIISLVLNLTILPYMMYGLEHSLLETAIEISLIFTAISMIRSFFFRRWFTRLTEKN